VQVTVEVEAVTADPEGGGADASDLLAARGALADVVFRAVGRACAGGEAGVPVRQRDAEVVDRAAIQVPDARIAEHVGGRHTDLQDVSTGAGEGEAFPVRQRAFARARSGADAPVPDLDAHPTEALLIGVAGLAGLARAVVGVNGVRGDIGTGVVRGACVSRRIVVRRIRVRLGRVGVFTGVRCGVAGDARAGRADPGAGAILVAHAGLGGARRR
jgi:hypothetical protein